MLGEIKRKRILVVGDVMLDTYYRGEVKRISPEAPVPVFKKKNEYSVLGGAANVAYNLRMSGQDVAIASFIGTDSAGDRIKNLLLEQDIDVSMLVSTDKNTTVKTRFMAANNQQVMRLDVEDAGFFSPGCYEKLLAVIGEKIGNFHAILISDYLKGALENTFTKQVIILANQRDIPVLIDVKDKEYDKYKGAFLLKPNLKELQDLVGLDNDDEQSIIAASDKLRQFCQCKYVLTTCGARGMILVGDEEPYIIPAVGKEVFDVTGAGDTTISYLTTCVANDMSIRDSVDISNIAASIQISKVGTSAVLLDEVKAALIQTHHLCNYKYLQGEELKNFRTDNKGKKVVFTNGCFDILHVGHIRCLREAASYGDLLIVGLNSDASVKRLKGEDRPINSEAERAEMLAALDCVDYIAVFDEDTPYNLINDIQPDVLAKGGDYRIEDVVGRDIVEKNNGKVVLIPFVDGKSTTNIIDKIKA